MHENAILSCPVQKVVESSREILEKKQPTPHPPHLLPNFNYLLANYWSGVRVRNINNNNNNAYLF